VVEGSCCIMSSTDDPEGDLVIRPQFKEEVRAKNGRVVQIIWLAMLNSIMVYGIVSVGLNQSNSRPPGADLVPEVVTLAFAALSFLCVVAAMIASRILLTTERLSAIGGIKPGSAPRSVTPGPGQLGLDPEGPEERRILTAWNRFQTYHIVVWTLAEGAATTGLVHSILSGTYNVFLPAAGASAFVFLMTQPSWTKFEPVMRQIEDETSFAS